jgi:hypothetical protein
MKKEKKVIGLKLVKDDCRLNFGECYPKQKDILIDAFENIWAYEEKIKSSQGEFAESILDSFDESRNYISSNANDETNDCSFLLTASTGSYLIHDLYEETIDYFTIVYYSISKVVVN